MATGAALAPTPTCKVFGPLSTQAGLQYWYLACFQDCIVAVRESAFALFTLGLANMPVNPAFGILGLVLQYVAKNQAVAIRKRIESLQATSLTRLRAKPNVSFPVSQLRSITFKDAKYGAFIVLPDIFLETNSGRKERFGLARDNFLEARDQLKQMYPQLCK